jgi:hypothetical protein
MVLLLIIFQPAEIMLCVKVTQIIPGIYFTTGHTTLLQKLFREVVHFLHHLGLKLRRFIFVRVKICNSNFVPFSFFFYFRNDGFVREYIPQILIVPNLF